jgi:hypothetical protein
MARPVEGRKLVQFEATEELVARADAAAERELLNRSSWLRRLVDSKGFEAVAEDGSSQGVFPSQKAAAAALQQLALHPACCGDR